MGAQSGYWRKDGRLFTEVKTEPSHLGTPRIATTVDATSVAADATDLS
jgi:hypothetical protein